MALVWGNPVMLGGKYVVNLLGATEDQLEILFAHELVSDIRTSPFRVSAAVVWLDQNAVMQYGAVRAVALLDEEIDEGAWLDWRWNNAIQRALHFSGEQ